MLTKYVTQSISVYLVCLVLFRIIQRVVSNPLKKLPGPWYTNITGIVQKYHAWRQQEHTYFMRLFDQYGPLVRTAPDRVGVGDWEMFKKMMSSHSFTKSSIYSDFAVVGENIFTTRCPMFNKIRRRQVGPTFMPQSIQKMESLVKENGVDSLCKYIDFMISKEDSDSAIINFYTSIAMMTTDVIGALAFGKGFGAIDLLISAYGGSASPSISVSEEDPKHESMTNSEIMSISADTMSFMCKIAAFPWIRQIPQFLIPSSIRKLSNSRDRLMKYAVDTVMGRRKELDLLNDSGKQAIDGGKTGNLLNTNNILDALIKARDPKTGISMTDSEIGAECIVLLSAGTDTVTNTLANCIRLLLINPSTYKIACDEVRSVYEGLGSETSVIDYATARESLPYLQAVIYETLRLRPATSGAWPRDVPKEGVMLGGHFIPHGTVLYGSIGGVHLDPKVWDEPSVFNPERFLGENKEEMKRKIVAFSTGARICPGRHLAMMEMLMTMATLLIRYEFSLPEEYDISKRAGNYFDELEEVCRITTGPLNPDRDLSFVVSRRNN